MSELETVSYDVASEMLGISKATLHNATSRGVLTPLPRRARKPGQLVKKQVELFIGKDLSLKWLSPSEAVIWQEIKNAVTSKKPVETTSTLSFELMQDNIAFVGALVEGVTDIAMEVIDEMIQAALSESLTTNTLIEHVKKSPSFLRITALLGVDIQAMPDETSKAINAMAQDLAMKVESKIFALLLKYAASDMSEKLHDFLPAPHVEREEHAS